MTRKKINDKSAKNNATNNKQENHTRRNFIHIMATTAIIPVAGAVSWTLVDQMQPDASVLAQGSKEVDLSAIEQGQAVKVMWRGKPVFIRYRSNNEIQAAVGTSLGDLKDKLSRSQLDDKETLDAKDENRRLKKQWLILVGICTHLGCIPLGTGENEERGDYGGWYCPCHGSHYDTSGRIRKGPAAENLVVPPYVFLSDTKIKIG